MKLHFAAAVVILGLTTILLPVGIRAGAVDSGLGPTDTYFVTQTSLGTPFQVDSGRLAEAKGPPKPFKATRS